MSVPPADPAPADGPAPSDAERRAVHAYAGTLLDPEAAGAAAEDALGAYERTRIPAGAASDPETLLALTRLMAAVSLPDRSRPEDRRQAVLASIGATSHCTCREAGPLLATRANGTIQPRESAALDDHLAGCAACRELERLTGAAEAAFRDQLTPPRAPFAAVAPRTALLALAGTAVAIGGIAAALAGGGSAHPGPAVAAPVQTQAPSRFAAGPARPRPAHRDAAVHHAPPRHRAMPRPDLTTVPAPPPAPDPTPATAPARATEAAAPAPGPSASPRPAVASAPAAASGPASLPAESAPQQGIGTLTSGG